MRHRQQLAPGKKQPTGKETAWKGHFRAKKKNERKLNAMSIHYIQDMYVKYFRHLFKYLDLDMDPSPGPLLGHYFRFG